MRSFLNTPQIIPEQSERTKYLTVSRAKKVAVRVQQVLFSTTVTGDERVHADHIRELVSIR